MIATRNLNKFAGSMCLFNFKIVVLFLAT